MRTLITVLVVLFLMLALLSLPLPVLAGDEGQVADDPAELTSLLAKRGEKPDEDKAESKEMRVRIIRDAGYTMGVQAGAKWRNEQIQVVLDKRAADLDRIFAFRLLLIDGQVLPPVIVRSDRSMQVNDRTVVRTGSSFKIIKDARFVSNPPSWRDYLLAEFSVGDISTHIYPRTDREVEEWEAAIRRGWTAGIAQADSIFVINLRKLTRDLRGLILFRQLAGQGYVSLPQVAQGQYAIRVGEKTLDLNQTSFSLVEDSRFQTEDKWAPFQMSQ